MTKELSHAKSPAFEEAASILANLAIEGIYLPLQQLEYVLERDFNLSPGSRRELIKIFKKPDDGKNAS